MGLEYQRSACFGFKAKVHKAPQHAQTEFLLEVDQALASCKTILCIKHIQLHIAINVAYVM